MEANKTLSTISSLSPKAELNILLDIKCMCLLAYIVQSNQQYVNSIFRKYMVALLLRIIDNLLNDIQYKEQADLPHDALRWPR